LKADSTKDKKELLTKSERKLWASMLQHKTLKEAAVDIGISPKTAYNMIDKLRRKYYDNMSFNNFINNAKGKNELISMLFTRRTRHRKKPSPEEDQEEDLAA